jgi:hypothetical protein
MSEVMEQKKMIEEYGMTDERYTNSFNELISTLCVRIFKNMIPIFLEVLEKMKTDLYFEKNICMTNGRLRSPQARSTSSDSSTKSSKATTTAAAPKSAMASWASSSSSLSSSRLIQAFQTEFAELVENSNNGETNLFCALTNSNIKFMNCMKEFLESVHKASGISIPVLEKSMSYQKLMKTFAEISNKTFLGIQEVVKILISDKFTGIKDHSGFHFVRMPLPRKASSKSCS